MKNPLKLILLCLFMASAQNSNPIVKNKQPNYKIGRSVIGSGGLTRATSTNYFHFATAGQTIAGSMQGANHRLFSGFWLPGWVPTEVSPEEVMNFPTSFSIHQNYPNPFNPETTIEYDLPVSCLVDVEIFNTVGQRVCLVSSQIEEMGHATAVWDGRNDQGKVMDSGIYFYRVTAFPVKNTETKNNALFCQTKKMLLVK